MDLLGLLEFVKTCVLIRDNAWEMSFTLLLSTCEGDSGRGILDFLGAGGGKVGRLKALDLTKRLSELA